jgi:hydroxymethylglutaryl-CoA lyase
MVDRFFQMGARAVTISDLQGVADKDETVRFFGELLELRKGADLERIGYHPHNVSGDEAVGSSLAVLGLGIRRFDASLGGTGGCVTGAPGNQPTELLVRRFHESGAVTGIDESLLDALASGIVARRASMGAAESEMPPGPLEQS